MDELTQFCHHVGYTIGKQLRLLWDILAKEIPSSHNPPQRLAQELPLSRGPFTQLYNLSVLLLSTQISVQLL